MTTVGLNVTPAEPNGVAAMMDKDLQAEARARADLCVLEFEANDLLGARFLAKGNRMQLVRRIADIVQQAEQRGYERGKHE